MAMKPIKVSQLNGYIKRVLQSDPLLGNVSVIGEVSNLKNHGSGHVYFTLKDEASKVNCFLSADVLKTLHFELAEGMEVTVAGYVYLFERGGTYSLNIRDIQVEGTGNLSVAFEKLKEKLSKEGLFDERHKKTLPFFPKNLVIITSETGAAVQDIIKIVKMRNNIVNILIYPVLVQGPNAAGEISAAIDYVNKVFTETDVIIVGRGGGSMEELWAFNEEIVARSIFGSKIPIISAVGHEIDFTIADFVADKRAETPTAAAQMAVPHIGELKDYLVSVKESMDQSFNNRIRYFEMVIEKHNLDMLKVGLQNRVENSFYKIDMIKTGIEAHVVSYMNKHSNRMEMSKQLLESLNPMNVLNRGYVAVTDEKGRIVSSVHHFNIHDLLTATFRDGQIDCKVMEIRGEENGNHE